MRIPDFDDIVFNGLNKEYGAYFLRKRYNRIVIVSVIAASVMGSLLVLIPYLRTTVNKNKETYTITTVMMENLSAPVGQVFVPEKPASAASQAEAAARFVAPEVRYVAPDVVDSILPADNEMILTADSLLGVIPGQENIRGEGTGTGSLTGSGGGGGGYGGNGAYAAVEIMPKFKGGDINRFREWVQKKTKYPEIATINGIQGKVYVTFIVDTNGSVTDVKVVRGVDPLIDVEALKAVMSSPKWTPGKERGVAVRVSYIIMLNFQL